MKANIGSVSSGTMRKEDLIPTFVDVLEQLASGKYEKDDWEFCCEIRKSMRNEDYFETLKADFNLDELFDRLCMYAPPYCYFGSHPGDGADYGFWIDKDIEREFDGLKASNLSMVPKDYEGEILLVNDHGNMGLYRKARTQKPREIWSV